MVVTFYKHHIPDWMDGTEGLDAETYRTYHTVCQLIYLNEAAITNNEYGIAGRCKQSLRTYRRCLATLLSQGKLTMFGDRIANERASIELKNVDLNRSHASQGGLASAGVPKRRGKLLKIHEPITVPLLDANSLKDKTRQDKTRPRTQEAATSAAVPGLFENTETKSDEEVALFRRGKQVLGNSSGGLIAKLLRASDGKVALARAVIEQASTKENPNEYVAAVLRGKAKDEKPKAII